MKRSYPKVDTGLNIDNGNNTSIKNDSSIIKEEIIISDDSDEEESIKSYTKLRKVTSVTGTEERFPRLDDASIDFHQVFILENAVMESSDMEMLQLNKIETISSDEEQNLDNTMESNDDLSSVNIQQLLHISENEASENDEDGDLYTMICPKCEQLRPSTNDIKCQLCKVKMLYKCKVCPKQCKSFIEIEKHFINDTDLHSLIKSRLKYKTVLCRISEFTSIEAIENHMKICSKPHQYQSKLESRDSQHLTNEHKEQITFEDTNDSLNHGNDENNPKDVDDNDKTNTEFESVNIGVTPNNCTPEANTKISIINELNDYLKKKDKILSKYSEEFVLHKNQGKSNSIAEMKKFHILTDEILSKYIIIEDITLYKKLIIDRLTIKEKRQLSSDYYMMCKNCKRRSKAIYNGESVQCPACSVDVVFRCSICSEVYENHQEIQEHMQNNLLDHCLQKKISSQGFIKCVQCAGTYKSLETLRKHDKVCRNHRPFKCKICLLRTDSMNNLLEHIIQVHTFGKNPITIIPNHIRRMYKRDFRRKAKPILDDKEINQRMIISRKEFIRMYCDVCPSVMKDGYEKVQDTCILCNFCNRQLIYFCTLCNIKYTNAEDVELHIKSSWHNDVYETTVAKVGDESGSERIVAMDKSKFHKCLRCNKHFLTKAYLTAHISSKCKGRTVPGPSSKTKATKR